MKSKRWIRLLWTAMAAVFFSGTPTTASDTVELNIENTLQLEAAALDVATSADGSRIFVLTDQGRIVVYSDKGVKEGQLDVGPGIDQVKVAPKGDTLLLNNRKDKTLQVVSLEFVYPIDVTGSPFKGRADAPVAVAFFTDFQ